MITGLALAAVTLAATTPPADVGIVFRSSAGTAELVAACPAIAVVETSTGGGELIRTFLASCPGSEAVFQLPVFPVTPAVASADDARFQASSYWSVFAPQALSALALTAGERGVVWVAAPPGFDAFPSWRDDPTCVAGALFCAADYVGAFFAELDRLARTDGFRGLLLAPFSPRPGDRPDALCALLAGVDRATGADVAWTWDAVSPGLARSALDESTSTFGYRQVRTTCASARVHPLLVRVSVVGGWQSRATAPEFLAWLEFLDVEVDADAEPFLGLAVFGHGTGGPHDLAPIASQLAAFLRDPSVPPGTEGGGGGGGPAPPSAPADAPGSNLGPDRGSSVGCSTAGAGNLALLAFVPFALRRQRVHST
jgi:hypothetical protein